MAEKKSLSDEDELELLAEVERELAESDTYMETNGALPEGEVLGVAGDSQEPEAPESESVEEELPEDARDSHGPSEDFPAVDGDAQNLENVVDLPEDSRDSPKPAENSPTTEGDSSESENLEVDLPEDEIMDSQRKQSTENTVTVGTNGDTLPECDQTGDQANEVNGASNEGEPAPQKSHGELHLTESAADLQGQNSINSKVDREGQNSVNDKDTAISSDQHSMNSETMADSQGQDCATSESIVAQGQHSSNENKLDEIEDIRKNVQATIAQSIGFLDSESSSLAGSSDVESAPPSVLNSNVASPVHTVSETNTDGANAASPERVGISVSDVPSEISPNHSKVSSLVNDKSTENTESEISQPIDRNTKCSENNSEQNDSKPQTDNIPENISPGANCDVSDTKSENTTVNCDSSSVQNSDNSEDRMCGDNISHSGPADCDTKSDTSQVPNGLRQKVMLLEMPEFKQLRQKCENLDKKLTEKEAECKSLATEKSTLSSQLRDAITDRDKYLAKLQDRDKDGDKHIAQVKQLEYQISKLEKEVQHSKEKLEKHDQAAKKAVTSLQNELQARVGQATKLCEDAKKERESMVIKYAQAEQKNMELQQKMGSAEVRFKEMNRERELAVQKLKAIKSDKDKMDQVFQSKGAEMSAIRKELERQKELVSTKDVTVKWGQNKLKAELESHKETKTRLEDASKQLKSAHEELEVFRRDVQNIIKTYHEQEEHKSSNQSPEEKVERRKELGLPKLEHNGMVEVHKLMRGHLDRWRRKNKEIVEELNTYKDKASCLESERRRQESALHKLEEIVQKQKEEIKGIQDRLTFLENIEREMKEVQIKNDKLKTKSLEIEDYNKDLLADMKKCTERESELLEFTQKVSDQNTKLQGENSTLETKLKGLTAEHERISEQFDTYQKRAKTLEEELTKERSERLGEHTYLSETLSKKSQAVDQLSQDLQDTKDEIKTLKRKHAANVKDITRQLLQAKKKLEGNTGDRDGISMGSRTSSNGSLNTVGMHHNDRTVSVSSDQQPPPPQDEEPFVHVVEVDKQMLMEKIVKLQKSHLRKGEKIEFMQDHINQLMDEVQKKAKIIQSYILREETGALSSSAMDVNKAQLAKKGGIMASLYSQHSQDKHMDIDMSLQINQKLQQVLEDTLLKNITLKDNLDTLGQEIARLSQENRKIQLAKQSKR